MEVLLTFRYFYIAFVNPCLRQINIKTQDDHHATMRVETVISGVVRNCRNQVKLENGTRGQDEEGIKPEVEMML